MQTKFIKAEEIKRDDQLVLSDYTVLALSVEPEHGSVRVTVPGEGEVWVAGESGPHQYRLKKHTENFFFPSDFPVEIIAK